MSSEALLVENLLTAEARPIGLLTSYFSTSEPSGRDLEAVFDEVLRRVRRDGVRPCRRTLGVSPAGPHAAGLLGVDVGSPLAWLEDSIHDTDGTFLALNFFRIRPDRTLLTTCVGP